MRLLDQPQLLPHATGQKWLVDGIRLFHRQPLVWILTLMTYWAGVVMIGILPIIGLFLPLLLTPGLGFGFIRLAQAIEEAKPTEPATPALLLSGFKTGHGRAMVILGLAYIAGITVVLLLAWAIDGEQITRLVQGKPNDADVEAMRSGIPLGLIIGMLAYLPIMMALWFAPQLVIWKQFTPGKALFYSFFAVWRNKAAFLRYSLAWLVLIVLVSIVSSLAFDLLGIGGPNVLLALLPVSMLLMAIAHGSFYASTRDVFGAPPEHSNDSDESDHSDDSDDSDTLELRDR